MMDQRMALIIGNTEYKDKNLARLLTPSEDAADLARVLYDPELGGFDEVECLINEPVATIRRAIALFFKQRKPSDLALLYFSGHGVRDQDGDLFLAAKDTEHTLLSATAIPSNFVTHEMDNSRSRRRVLILDCCHSGAFAHGSKGATGATVGTGPAFKGTGSGKVVMTATDATQYAWEGENIAGDADNSVFTRFLIEGIKTGRADINADGQITLDELFDYAYEKVVTEARNQQPTKWAWKQQGDIIIARNPNPVPEARATETATILQPSVPAPKAIPQSRMPRWGWLLIVSLVVILFGGLLFVLSQNDATLPAFVATHEPTVQPATATLAPVIEVTESPRPSATMPSPTIEVTESVEPNGQSLLTKAQDSASIFSQPSANSDELSIVRVGEAVTIGGRSPTGNWLFVQAENGLEGYVDRFRFDWNGDFEALIAVTPQASSAPRSTPAQTPPGTVSPTSDFIGIDFWPNPGEIEGHCGTAPGYTLLIQGQGTIMPFDYFIHGELVQSGDNGRDPFSYNFEFPMAQPSIEVIGVVVASDGRSVRKSLFLTRPGC